MSREEKLKIAKINLSLAVKECLDTELNTSEILCEVGKAVDLCKGLIKNDINEMLCIMYDVANASGFSKRKLDRFELICYAGLVQKVYAKGITTHSDSQIKFYNKVVESYWHLDDSDRLHIANQYSVFSKILIMGKPNV